MEASAEQTVERSALIEHTGGRLRGRPNCIEPDLAVGMQRQKQRDHAERGRESSTRGSQDQEARGGGVTVMTAFRIPNPSSTYRSASGSVIHRSPSTMNMYLCRPGRSA